MGSGEAAWCAGARLGAFHRIAGIGFEDIHADEELEEGRDAGEASADGYWRRFTPREADAMSEAEDVLGSDLIGRLLEGAEEVAESAVVGVRGAVGAGAALFLGEEGVEGALPARVGTREDGRQSLSGGHGGLLDEEERPHDLCSGLQIYQALCVNSVALLWH